MFHNQHEEPLINSCLLKKIVYCKVRKYKIATKRKRGRYIRMPYYREVTSHHALQPASPNPGKCPRSFAHSPHSLAGFRCSSLLIAPAPPDDPGRDCHLIHAILRGYPSQASPIIAIYCLLGTWRGWPGPTSLRHVDGRQAG